MVENGRPTGSLHNGKASAREQRESAEIQLFGHGIFPSRLMILVICGLATDIGLGMRPARISSRFKAGITRED